MTTGILECSHGYVTVMTVADVNAGVITISRRCVQAQETYISKSLPYLAPGIRFMYKQQNLSTARPPQPAN